MRLSEAIQGFNISRLAEGYSKNTIDRYGYCLRLLGDFLGDKEIEEITSEDLRHFFYYLRTDYHPRRSDNNTSPLSSASLSNFWKSIRSLFNWSSNELGLLERPDTNLPAPKVEPAVITPFDDSEIKALLKASEFTANSCTNLRKSYQQKRPTAFRDRALVLLLLDSGLRVSEACRLKVEDVNLETGEVFVQPFGSGRKTKSRHVYLGKACRQAVWLYLANRDDVFSDDPLFLTKQYRPMNRHNIRHLLRRLGKRARVPNVHPHRFRHTFAIQYLRNGGDVFTLQRLLGQLV